MKAIAAVSQNGVIGKNGDLPWRISGDLQWFKKITMGHVLLMGRKTWQSLPKALPGRENWVLSRTMSPEEGMKVFRSVEEAKEELDGRTLFSENLIEFVHVEKNSSCKEALSQLVRGSDIPLVLLPGLDCCRLSSFHLDLHRVFSAHGRANRSLSGLP